MCILASITAALLCWPLLAVLALRLTDRLASHPVLFAKTSHLFLDEYLAQLLARTRSSGRCLVDPADQTPRAEAFRQFKLKSISR